MFKFSKIGLAVLLAAGSVTAEDYTLVEKDTYGTGIYYQGAVANDLIFTNSAMKKIELFDMSTASRLIKNADIPFECDFAVSSITSDGNIVAAHCGFAIEFFDVSDANNIVSVGKYNSTSYAINSIILEGGRLYMLGGNTDVLVFDASDLSNIVELGRNDVGEVQTIEMKKQGDFLYAINFYNKMDIYNIADPANPLKIGSHPAVGTQFYSIEINGDYAYLGSGQGLQVVNISTPTEPTLVTNLSQDENLNTLSAFWSMDFDGANFIVATDDKKIRSIDLTIPNAPVISDSLMTLKYPAKDIELNGESLVVFNGVDGIRTLEISDLNSTEYDAHFTNSMAPTNISLNGNKALVADEESVYHVIELDSELNISEKGRIGGHFNFSDGLLSGDIARMSTNNTIYTTDISDLENIVQTDVDTLGTSASTLNSFEAFDEQMILGTSMAELAIYDINELGLEEDLVVNLGTDPISNAYRGVIDIAKKGHYIFVTTEETDVSVVDLTDISNPTVTHHEWSAYDGSDRHLEVFGNRLFIARDVGMLVVDISVPTAPTFVETSTAYGIPDTIQAIDERYAVIASDSTLYLVDFEDEINPLVVDEVELGMRVQDLGADLQKVILSEKFGPTLKSFQVNQAPIAVASNSLVDEDTQLNDLLSVSDRENDSFTVAVTQDVNNGVLNVNNDGTFSYTPNVNYFGTDSFIYEVTGRYGKTISSQVDISINAINDMPTVETDSLFLNEDSQLAATLSGSDIEGSELTYSMLSEPSSGTLNMSENGTLAYDPELNYFGEVTFDVVASDGELNSPIKTVTLTILPVNDIPVVSIETLATDEDNEVIGMATATDVDSDTFTFSLLQDAANGSAVVSSDGSYTYTPSSNYNGEDSFTLVASDGTDVSESVTVDVVVSAVNDAPTATNVTGTVVEGEVLSGSLTAGDVDGDELIFTVETNPNNGALTVSTSGRYTYTPAVDFVGTDSFTYKVTDPSGESATATVSLTVTEKTSNGGGSIFWLLTLVLFIRSPKFNQ
jgi:hypothetical protein